MKRITAQGLRAYFKRQARNSYMVGDSVRCIVAWYVRNAEKKTAHIRVLPFQVKVDDRLIKTPKWFPQLIHAIDRSGSPAFGQDRYQMITGAEALRILNEVTGREP